jgi:hypothetical protein
MEMLKCFHIVSCGNTVLCCIYKHLVGVAITLDDLMDVLEDVVGVASAIDKCVFEFLMRAFEP